MRCKFVQISSNLSKRLTKIQVLLSSNATFKGFTSTIGEMFKGSSTILRPGSRRSSKGSRSEILLLGPSPSHADPIDLFFDDILDGNCCGQHLASRFRFKFMGTLKNSQKNTMKYKNEMTNKVNTGHFYSYFGWYVLTLKAPLSLDNKNHIG